MMTSLLTSRKVYGGRTLFEQFDEDVQSQIRILIEELISVIGQAHQILDPHASYSSLIPSHQSQLETNLSSLSTKTFISWKPTDASRKATTSINRWRWSLWDKKRVSTIVKNFVNLNNRIHGNIKLWCLCTSVGINPQHLTRLRDEESSKQLGFNNDAVMQLAATDLQMTDMSLELRDRELHLGAQRSALLEGRFRMFDWGQAPVFVEYRRRLAGIDNHQGLMDHRTKIRVEKLARLLHQPKEQVFRTPSCIGWLVDPINNDIGFVYAVPQATGMPMSLLRAFDIKDLRASLGQKFRLAHELARCVSQLQLVKWLHESFRSDSILLFPRDYERQGGPSGVTTSLDYSQPWVLGFEFSRAEDDVSLGINDPCLERDVYRHPDRQRAPTKHFTKLHDIYALGVVLLEIGMFISTSCNTWANGDRVVAIRYFYGQIPVLEIARPQNDPEAPHTPG